MIVQVKHFFESFIQFQQDLSKSRYYLVKSLTYVCIFINIRLYFLKNKFGKIIKP